MPITPEQVVPGLKVRVVSNEAWGYQPDGNRRLKPGDIIVLNGWIGGEDPVRAPAASYALSNGSYNVMYLADLELADATDALSPSPTPAPHACRCTMLQLLQAGCRCGGN